MSDTARRAAERIERWFGSSNIQRKDVVEIERIIRDETDTGPVMSLYLFDELLAHANRLAGLVECWDKYADQNPAITDYRAWKEEHGIE